MKWYLARRWSIDIEEREVLKETLHCLIFNGGRREYKKSDGYDWFKTREEARQHIENRLKKEIEILQNKLERTNKNLITIQSS